MNKSIISLLALLLLFTAITYGQQIAVKTNMLYWITSTPKLVSILDQVKVLQEQRMRLKPY